MYYKALIYVLPILIELQNFHKVFLFVIPAKIHLKLSGSTINLSANDNEFSVFVELENYDTNFFNIYYKLFAVSMSLI